MRNLKTALDGAVRDAKRWRDVCNAAVQAVGGTGGVFLPFDAIHDPKRIAYSDDLGQFVDQYASLHVGFYDIRPETTSLLKALGVICHEDIPVNERPSLSEGAMVFDSHSFDRFTAIHICCGNEDWCLAIRNPSGQYSERSKHSKLINEIRGQIQSVIDQTEVVRASQMEAWRSLFAANAGQVYALSPEGAIFSHNGDGAWTEAAAKVVAGHNSSLAERIDVDRISDQLRSMIKDTDEFNLPVISTRSDGSAQVTEILHLPEEVLDFYARHVALLVVREGVMAPRKTEQFLAENYALLPSEIRVAMGIASGLSPKEIARQHSIAEGTARQQLKSVYRKVGVNSQIQLAALIGRFGT